MLETRPERPVAPGRAGPLNILLTEGSSTSARHALYALGPLGHRIDFCDPQHWCMARFSRYVRKAFRCPSFLHDPADYLQFLADRLRAEPYDVLLPVHDQVNLLARFREQFGRRVGLAVPEIAAVAQLQGKADFARLLEELGLPQPAMRIARTREACVPPRGFPCYVKRNYSTASTGVWFVEDQVQLDDLLDRLQREGAFNGRHEFLVQQPATGQFCVVQSVFQRGRLVGAHSYRVRRRGIGESPQAREGDRHPVVHEHLRKLGAHLGWHGALHLEYFLHGETSEVQYVEANPRIGETLNATLSGMNLCERLVRVSLGERLPDFDAGSPDENSAPMDARPSARTHSLTSALLEIARTRQGRAALLREMWQAVRGRGVYAASEEELARFDDCRSFLPMIYVYAQLLAAPGRADRIVDQAVRNVTLSEEALQRFDEISAQDVERWFAQRKPALT